MKYYVSLLVLGLAIGFTPQVMAGMLSDENANKNTDTNIGGASDAELNDMAAEFRGEKTADTATTEKSDAEKKADEVAEKKEKEREDACKTAADASKPDGERAAAQNKCSQVTVNTPTPQSYATATDYKAMGEAHSKMLSGELTKATENLSGFKTIDVTQGGSVDTSKLMSTESLLTKDVELDTTTGAPGGIHTVKTQTYDAADIREFQGKATVVIGGDSSLGFNANANKYQSMRGGSVQWDDSLLLTDVETARSVRFGQSELSPKGTNYNGFNQSVGIEKGVKLGGLSSNQLEMAAYIDARGRDLGASEAERAVAIATVMRESKFDSMVSANPNGTGPYKLYVDSSAYGLGQYINGTWVNQFDPKKMGSYVMNGGEVLNRNNTTNQIDVLYNNIGQRYDSYSNSANMQNKYTFAEYDYIHHYAGGFNAEQDRIAYAVKYTRDNRLLNDTVANYVMHGDGTGSIVSKPQKIYPWVNTTSTGNAYNGVAVGTVSTGNNGLGRTVQNILGNITGGSNSAVANAVNSMFANGGINANGTVNVGNIMSALAGSGLGGSAGVNQNIVTALLGQLLSGGGTSSGSTKTSTTKTDTTKTTTSGRTYDAIKTLQSTCGGDLPKSKDAIMLMIKKCQS